MKSFECESSSGDEATVYPISRAIVEAPQWLRGGTTSAWNWQPNVSTQQSEIGLVLVG